MTKVKSPHLFRDQSQAFRQFRPEYPQSLYDWMRSIIPNDQRDSVVDIACGVGKSTGNLKQIFRNVYGLDLEENQIRQAKQLYPEIQFLVSTAEQGAFRKGTMDCITVATAFYWFNMAKALEEFRRLLKPQGHLFVYQYYYPVPQKPKILEIQRREYDTNWKYCRDPRLSFDRGFGDLLMRSCLCQRITYQQFPNLVQMNAAQIAGFWSSSSYGAAFAKNKTNPQGYWKALEQEFDAILKGSTVIMDFTVHAWHGQLIA
jgi:ubiquinone/menaquinone biosynthesis C-methylase UbiE